MLQYKTLIQMLDKQVDALLPRQVMDENRGDFGGFVSDGIAHPTSVSSLSTFGYAYVLEDSSYYLNEELLNRILAGTAFGRRVRRDSGCFDLITTNFDSSPDTGFLVKAIAPVVFAARKIDHEGARKVADALGEIIQSAIPGMVHGGFHTPNHRWVLTAALSMALKLYPQMDGMETVERYLAETIDINDDGEYIERSAGGYNAICNRSLRLAAEVLERPDLLEPVRRNLDLSYHMLHDDGTVVTSFSNRQDRGQRVSLINMADSFYYVARNDDNGFYAAVADWLFSESPGGLPWTLEPFLSHPEWREDTLPRETLSTSYARVYPSARLWRVRRGKTSATAGAGSSAPFSVRHGAVELTSVGFCASYFAVAQFSGETFETSNGNVIMTHWSRGELHDSPVYYQPIGRPVAFDDFYEDRINRDVYKLPPLETRLEIEETNGGFDLHIRCTGYDRVPFQVACDFAPDSEIETESGASFGRAGEVLILKSGYAVCHHGDDAISVGPGAYAHRFWSMRGSESAPDRFRILMTFLTPVDQVIEVRCGMWSAAEERLM